MTVYARRAADVDLLARLRRMVENALPWYSPEDERKHRAYTADLERRGKTAIDSIEQIRQDYLKAGNRAARRR